MPVYCWSRTRRALTGAVEWPIFGLASVAGVALLRVYVQDKDPTDVRDLLSPRRKTRAGYRAAPTAKDDAAAA